MDRPSGSISTGHHHSHQQRQQQRRTQERGVDMICRIKYGNTLPDLPFEPKFLQSPFIALNRFISYTPSTLEKNFKYELLTEPDLNVKIDLIDPMTYYCDPMEKPPLDPIDEQLLEDESISQLNTRRSIQHRKVVPWMRKTEYISTEFNRYGIGQTGAERPDTKIGYGMKKRIKDEPFEYKDRDSQMAAIQRTFSEAQKSVKRHYSKQGVTAVEELPIFPDFDLWKYPFAQVIFDADPLPYCKEHRMEKLTEAMLKGMADTEGNQFVGYFAPLDEALQQRMLDDQEEYGSYKEGMEYHYKLEREYNWTVQNKNTKGFEGESYFLIRRGQTFCYNELDTKVKLTRRPKGISTAKNTLLSVINRQMNSKELAAMTSRENELYGIQEEEAEEAEQAENEGEEGAGEMDEDAKSAKSDDEALDRKSPEGKSDGENKMGSKLKSSSQNSAKEEESSEENEKEDDGCGREMSKKAENGEEEEKSSEEEEESSSESEEEDSSEEEEEEDERLEE